VCHNAVTEESQSFSIILKQKVSDKVLAFKDLTDQYLGIITKTPSHAITYVAGFKLSSETKDLFHIC